MASLTARDESGAFASGGVLATASKQHNGWRAACMDEPHADTSVSGEIVRQCLALTVVTCLCVAQWL